jgi:hypothetical protein
VDRAPKADSVEDFTRLLVRSGLVSEDRVAVLVDEFHNQFLPTSKLANTITAFCSFAVGNGEITSWQCEKLRKGQWKGFFDLEGFVMLDNFEPDSEYAHFLARDLKTGGIVRVAVTPPSKWKDGRVEFRVDHRYE